MKDKLLAPGFELWTAGVERLQTLYVQTRVNVAATVKFDLIKIFDNKKAKLTFLANGKKNSVVNFLARGFSKLKK